VIIDVAPNFERIGVVAGFVLGFAEEYSAQYARVVTCSTGVLFAQGLMYRPTSSPELPLVPLNQQSWLYYNSDTGFYWQASPASLHSGDAALGWAVANSSRVIAVSRQRIEVEDSSDSTTTVISLGATVPSGPDEETYGDTDVPNGPPGLLWVIKPGHLAFGDITTSAFQNSASVKTIVLVTLFRDETGSSTADLAADVDAAATTWDVSDGSGFQVGKYYQVDREIILIQSIDGNQLRVLRGQYSQGDNRTYATAHSGPKTVTDATNATPIVVSCSGHGRTNREIVEITGAAGNTAANSRWKMANATDSTFELEGSSGSGAYTSGGILRGAQLWALQQKIATFSFSPQFFTLAEAKDWKGDVTLPSALLCAGQLWATNAWGKGTVAVINYLPTYPDEAWVTWDDAPWWHTGFGQQIDLQVDGLLAVRSNAASRVTVPSACSARLLTAYVDQTPVGGPIVAAVTVNGSLWARIAIPEGATSASPRSGLALGGLSAGAVVGLDIERVGTTYPGKRLDVRLLL
jgi:hypothetical protein